MRQRVLHEHPARSTCCYRRHPRPAPCVARDYGHHGHHGPIVTIVIHPPSRLARTTASCRARNPHHPAPSRPRSPFSHSRSRSRKHKHTRRGGRRRDHAIADARDGRQARLQHAVEHVHVAPGLALVQLVKEIESKLVEDIACRAACRRASPACQNRHATSLRRSRQRANVARSCLPMPAHA